MKKRFLSLVLTMAMVLGLAVTALAAGPSVELPAGDFRPPRNTYTAQTRVTALDANITHITAPEEAPNGWDIDVYIYDAILADAPNVDDAPYPEPEAGYTLLVQYGPSVFATLAEMPPYLEDYGEWGGYDPSYVYDFRFDLPVPQGYDPASAKYYDKGFRAVESHTANTVSLTVPMNVESSSVAGYIMGYGHDYGLDEEIWGIVVEYKPLGAAAPVIISKGKNPSDTGTAGQSTQTVTVGGKKIELQAYKLASPDGDTNYVKIRDVAAALDGTAAQFNVGWDGAVNLEKGKAYTDRNGQENKTPYSGDRAYEKSTAATKVNGVTVELQAFIIKDDQGKGSTYYKLRDIGQALGFNVGFSGERGIYIEPDKAYDQGD